MGSTQMPYLDCLDVCSKPSLTYNYKIQNLYHWERYYENNTNHLLDLIPISLRLLCLSHAGFQFVQHILCICISVFALFSLPGMLFLRSLITRLITLESSGKILGY